MTAPASYAPAARLYTTSDLAAEPFTEEEVELLALELEGSARRMAPTASEALRAILAVWPTRAVVPSIVSCDLWASEGRVGRVWVSGVFEGPAPVKFALQVRGYSTWGSAFRGGEDTRGLQWHVQNDRGTSVERSVVGVSTVRGMNSAIALWERENAAPPKVEGLLPWLRRYSEELRGVLVAGLQDGDLHRALHMAGAPVVRPRQPERVCKRSRRAPGRKRR